MSDLSLPLLVFQDFTAPHGGIWVTLIVQYCFTRTTLDYNRSDEINGVKKASSSAAPHAHWRTLGGGMSLSLLVGAEGLAGSTSKIEGIAGVLGLEGLLRGGFWLVTWVDLGVVPSLVMPVTISELLWNSGLEIPLHGH